MHKKASPRSSPLLQFFTSATSGSNGNAATSPSSATTGGGGDNDSTTSSTIIRSLSKCFDGGGVAMEDAILNEEERAMIDKARKVGVVDNDHYDGTNCGGHAYNLDQITLTHTFPKNKQSKTGFGKSFNLFKPTASKKSSAAAIPPPSSPSKGSHTNNSNSASNKTDPTGPITTSTTTGERHYQSQHFSLKTGMSSAPTTPGSHHMASSAATTTNTTTAAMGGSTSAAVIANFWNNHAQPATAATSCVGGGMDAASSSRSSAASPLHSATSPLSTSAKAAADAVMGMISKAENFIVTSTGVSPSSGGGFCSPRNSPSSSSLAEMEGIPEGDERTHEGENNCCGNDNHCFEFEDFGFNAFQDDRKQQRGEHSSGGTDEKSTAVAPRGQNSPSPTRSVPEQPKGYEIRLKSTFSQVKVQKEIQKDHKKQPTPLAAAFGRTHPNNSKKSSNAASQSSRALPDGLPFQEVSVPTEIERSVSELTMRSHGAFERHRYTSDSRRMAYYAVGRTANNDDNGTSNKGGGNGNRRCYFTGNAIPYGTPFYAGGVQQGPRTLVVFCLPSALGLPMFSNLQAAARATPLHRFSSADREKYLDSLPEPDTKLLQEMSQRYPEPFDTLPVQVRSPHCWRLFVKFCFFSGLPIAEGEMHYRVKGSVAVFPQQQSSEEIALSHEVMEAVNGEVSAEMLRLPNQKVFDYLKRQYSQQSSKLNDEVFDRKSWELVMPEV
mmetsp:Transcript_8286/g.18559  ORF Transcript_8286/g.18559 Transcript_8286/m.18559 type:complete len:722 (+) Transcript_8286:303-2468(+)|eukprot:CAMPEP_0172315790 /NCGR_PEP_ID=MMETSP1058-20130122/26306_1 /TAXON_ID=83371 /ORGANISM="Detonula confervacea, Strain CCMP 353" /LENGTH=721 /DNA_ID=CAMNT_0013029953 /DNA_START=249 /DNA_END=2414 /DNA_ORIENTATION=+